MPRIGIGKGLGRRRSGTNWASSFGCLLTDQSVLTPVVFQYLNIGGGGTINIDWDDGTNQDYSGNNTDITKNYTIAKNPYHIQITGDVDKITWFEHHSQSKTYGDITDWVLPSFLQVFHFYNNNVTGNVEKMIASFHEGLGVFHVGTNHNLTGDWTGVIYPSTLYDLHLAWNHFTGNPFINAFPDILQHIAFNNNDFNADITGLIIPSACTMLLLQDNTNIYGSASGWTIATQLTTLYLFGTQITADVSSWVMPTSVQPSMAWYWYLYGLNFIGDMSGAVIPACDQNIYLNFLGCNITKLPRGNFRWVNVFNFSGNNCDTAEIDDFLADVDAYFAGGVVPLTDCVYTLNGVGMGAPTGGDSNPNRLSIIAKYIAAGKTATIYNLASGFCAEYQAVYDSFTTKPTNADATAQNTIVETIVTAGLWTELDRFAFFAQVTNGAGEALKNWKNPGTGDLTLAFGAGGSDLTFTPHIGFVGNGANKSYIKSTYVLGTDNVKFTLNSAVMSVGSYVNIGSSNEEQAAAYDGTNQVLLGIKFGDGKAYALLNQSGLTPHPIVANTKGHFVVSRTASDAIFFLQNKAITSDTTVSTAIPTKEIYLLCRNNNGTPDMYSSYTLMYWFVGSGLSEANCNVITDAIEVYLDYKGNGLIP